MNPGPSLDTDPVASWLLTQSRAIADSALLVGEICNRLLASGLPLERVFITIRTLHPQVVANAHQWSRGDPIARVTAREYGVFQTEFYLASPIRVIWERRADEIRRRLIGEAPKMDFPILHDLKEEGMTDYLVLPVPFTGERINVITLATKNPDGFSDADISRIKKLMPLIGMAMELREDRRMMATLLDTYLGHDAGGRVLSGQILRGEGITIAAALFYCDLRGFTGLSESLPRAEVIELLNDYFGCMARPIEEAGGEVLKFIGDAMLAIFPILDDLDRDRACLTALDAAKTALGDLTRLNAVRAQAGKPRIRSGIALHTGSVTYGNIGAPDRLDFTAIGPAVNLVVRLERLCRTLEKPLIASDRFASPCGLAMMPLGRHMLPGIASPQAVFGLPDDVVGALVESQP